MPGPHAQRLLRPGSAEWEEPDQAANAAFEGQFSRGNPIQQQQQQQQQAPQLKRQNEHLLREPLSPSCRWDSAKERNGSGGVGGGKDCEGGGGGGSKVGGDPPDASRKRVLLLACLCILGTELCERLAYYGLQTNLGLYLVKWLEYPADEASQLLQVWKATVYMTPLAGAFLADALLGRFWTILLFSGVYFMGMAGITLTNALPALAPREFGAPPAGLGASRASMWAFLYLTAVGSGGVKPCVAAFGADQFREGEEALRASFFNYFYSAINVGALLASTVIVGVQESAGYAIGFGLPTVAFAVAAAVFFFGVKLYVRLPPEGSPFTRFARVFRAAFAKRRLPLPDDARDLCHDDSLGFVMPHTPAMRWLDKASIVVAPLHAGDDNDDDPKTHRHQRRLKPLPPVASVTEVAEVKALLALLPAFLVIALSQAGTDALHTLLPLTGDTMDRELWPGGPIVPASSVSTANTAAVIIASVLYDVALVPLCTRLFGRPPSITTRIGIGFAIDVVALLSAALIERQRMLVVAAAGLQEQFLAAGPSADPNAPEFTVPVSVMLQAIPYALTGVAEVFGNIGALELFYVAVSPGTRSLGASVNLLSVAVGTYLAAGLNEVVDAATTREPWLATVALFGHYDRFYLVSAGVVLLSLVLWFAAVAPRLRPLVAAATAAEGELVLVADDCQLVPVVVPAAAAAGGGGRGASGGGARAGKGKTGGDAL